jgi:hypothetical protein
MSIDLSALFETQVYVEDVQSASEAIAHALEEYESKSHIGARVFEVVAPDDPDEAWVTERLVHPLIYFCESEGFSIPNCRGVLVALYVGNTLHAIAAEQVIRWAAEEIGSTVENLHDRFGTHESTTSPPGA